MRDFFQALFAMSVIGRHMPRMLRSALAVPLLIRGPASFCAQVMVPALRRIAEKALHRVRDTRLHDLKKLFAASFEARFLVAAACNRSISEFRSATRSV